jgi:GNAT superfamily N-acetyltransferase
MPSPPDDAPPVRFAAVPPTHTDAVALARQAPDEGARTYTDLDLSYAPSLVRLLADRRGGVLVAYVADEPVACGAVRLLDPETAEIKRMFVTPDRRGRGVGRRLLDALERAAADLGCRRVRLDTGERQRAALALYRSAGYAEIEAYNVQPGASHWFEKRLA